jgi:DNA-binding response OmpR family regulator
VENKQRVLVVDDEAEIREMLSEYLNSHGFEVMAADSGKAMRELLAKNVPDVVLLDVNLPGEDGLTLARYIRERFDLPIIMVTAADEVVDRVVGLEVGADDYLTKPFDMQVLLARVHALLRRTVRADGEPQAAPGKTGSGTIFRFGRFTLDTGRYVLERDGDAVPLNAQEYRLLEVLARNPGRVLSRDVLLNEAWGYDAETTTRTVDVHVAWLRQKLGEKDHPRHLTTVRGYGYKFIPDA